MQLARGAHLGALRNLPTSQEGPWISRNMRKQWDGLLLTLPFRRQCARMVSGTNHSEEEEESIPLVTFG